jgi:hypothetical protein
MITKITSVDNGGQQMGSLVQVPIRWHAYRQIINPV